MMEKDSALQLAAAIAAGKLTAVEAAKQAFERIKATAGLNAVLPGGEESALAGAERVQREIERRLSAGEELPPLAGVPIIIKDNICVRGFKATCASKMLQGWMPPYDASVVRRLREHLLVPLAKSNMDEFAMGALGENSAFGAIKNPLDIQRSAGGSSGGSAAAVAAGLTLLALGSDTGGSLRLPAAYCGITAVKPTYGVVSRYGLIAFASSLEQIGPMARSAGECAALLDVIRGRDERDATSRDMEEVCIKKDMRQVKIGLVRELMDMAQLSADMRRAVEHTAGLFRALGAQVKEISLPQVKDAARAYFIISSAEASSNLARFDGVRFGLRADSTQNAEELMLHSRSQGFGREVKKRILLGTYALSAGYYDKYYLRARQAAERLKAAVNAALEEVDVLLMPSAPGVAPLLGADADEAGVYEADVFTVPANLTGLPAVSFPCAEGENGLPLGAQLMGREGSERQLLACVQAFEDLSDGQGKTQ